MGSRGFLFLIFNSVFLSFNAFNAGLMSSECLKNFLHLTLSMEHFKDKYLSFSAVGKLIQKKLEGRIGEICKNHLSSSYTRICRILLS